MERGLPILSPIRNNALAAQPRPQDALAALVFADVLKPLTASLGPLGDTLAAAVADTAFLRGAR